MEGSLVIEIQKLSCDVIIVNMDDYEKFISNKPTKYEVTLKML